ncbi:hypothetical protein, variant [Aphanomyces invadans]|uniref:3'-5' exonuclease domain-containing protein n=1 Tax=Aphanomyces invadans TaxID=157072 RepID=A0A024TFR8_9STRA|nr:hypothetical protein, variant [Aphanomyces invadans]ETV92207.1 hypothetical protein, variant [Aphanomyces invadans]|eukprot:XP_008879171.1 hypothetical protein, variant [Aphanomyces invadans]
MEEEDQWRRQRRRKIVKDLEWVLNSPHILSSRFQVLPTHISQTILALESTQAWLDELNENPMPLYTFLAAKRRDRASLALGVYFASLLEFWLRHCPSWTVEHLVVGQQLVTVKASRTVGQLKFVFRMFLPSSSSEFVDMHWEASIKFFLLTTISPPSPSGDSPIKLEHFVGPHLGENLAWRASEVSRKLDMCRLDVVRAWLASHFASPAATLSSPLNDAAAIDKSHHVQSYMLLRGYLFYPLAHLPSTTGCRSVIHVSSDIEPAHLRGWWTVDFASELVRAAPADARWAILPKVHWLSPVIARLSLGRTDEDENAWAIEGDAELGLDPIPLMDRAALFHVCTGHFKHSPTAMPLLVAELRLVQNGADERDNGTNPPTSASPRRLYAEVSRGFVMNPDTWKPQPLTQDALRFRRNKPPNPPQVEKTSLFNGALFESMPWPHHHCEREYEPPRPSLDEITMHVAVRMHHNDDESTAPANAVDEPTLTALLRRAQATPEANVEDHVPTATTLVQQVNVLLRHKLASAGQFIPSHGAIKGAIHSVLRARDKCFIGDCTAAVVEYGTTGGASDSNTKDMLRVGHLILDAAPNATKDNETAPTRLANRLASIFHDALSDSAKWWSVRFLVKAKQTLLNEVRASAMESALERNGDGGAMEDVMTRMLEPDHRGKWHMTVVDLCAAYGLPRAEATASTMLTKLLDANDPVAAEAFVLSQQRCTSRTHRLTQAFMRHSNTRTKAAKRLAALFHSILPSHTPHAANQRPIVNQDHQLTLVQDVLATRLSVHLVETPDDVTSMMHWMDEALMDPNHSPNEQPTKVVIVGLDCEWRPRAFSTKRDTTLDDDTPDLEQIQVIQVAFPHGHVYVLDCMAPSVIDVVVPLFRHLSRPWVVVTGFCVSGDLDRLVASHPGLTDVVHSPDFTCVELRRVAVARAKPNDVPTVQRMGLAGLAASYLNLRIPKDQQTSDWAVRPLSADQIEYAAMDAHCVRLLLLYFTAGLDGPDPVQEPWTISSSLWTAWRVHLQAYLGEADVVAAVASLGLSGTFHTLPTQPHCAVDREGHTVIKTVAWVVQHAQHHHASAAACGRSPVQFLAVMVDLAKTIDENKLHSFVLSKLGLSSCAISLASERVRLLN